jgi:hypothetical protein
MEWLAALAGTSLLCTPSQAAYLINPPAEVARETYQMAAQATASQANPDPYIWGTGTWANTDNNPGGWGSSDGWGDVGNWGPQD